MPQYRQYSQVVGSPGSEELASLGLAGGVSAPRAIGSNGKAPIPNSVADNFATKLRRLLLRATARVESSMNASSHFISAAPTRPAISVHARRTLAANRRRAA